jgi:hypothetical protein
MGIRSFTMPRPPAGWWRRWLVPASAALFLVYAVNFLCFFVDDEAITFMDAQYLLRGHGLTSSPFEGRVEGYSNFLHVLTASVLLAAVNVVGLPKIAVFAAAKLWSLACGAALVVVVGAAQRRWLGEQPLAQLAGLAVVTLAGPLAVWSCSSLETVPFVLAFTAFLVAVLGGSGRFGPFTVAIGAVTLLIRIDGFLFVGVAVSGAFLIGSAEQRRLLLRRVALPLLGVFLVYHAWRYWYFEALLPPPLYSKVLYKLLPDDRVISYLPATSYLARFLEHYRPILVGVLALGWIPFWRRADDRRPFMLLAIGAVLAAYASIVGDWMFGFRFFVPVVPLLALLAAWTVAAVSRRHAAAGAVCAAAVVVASASQAREFVRTFERADQVVSWQSWWTRPTLDPARFFEPYYDFYQDARDLLTPGTVVVNHEGGFLPFMLDLDNIESLGLCSRFFARLPTADVIFTEVGRYHALTGRPALRAGTRYLLYRRPKYLVSFRRYLLNANSGHVPTELLGGHFRLVLESTHQVLYERVEQPLPPASPELFLENLAHPARVRMAAMRGARIEPGLVRDALPFLWTETGTYPVDGSLSFEFHVGEDPVFELWIDSIRTTADADVVISLRGTQGETVQDRLHLAAGQPLRYHRRLERPVAGGVFVISVAAAARDAAVALQDLRVLGQTPALRAYIEKELFGERPGAIGPGL